MKDETDQRTDSGEDKLAEAPVEGGAADFESWEKKLADEWGKGGREERVADFGNGGCIRAPFLRKQYYRLSALPTPALVGARRLRGACVVGSLDLSYIDMEDRWILLEDCELDDVLLRGARVKGLRLRGCVVRSLLAKELDAPGGVWLDKSGLRDFEAYARVDIAGSTIGRLNCAGSRLCNPAGYALNADGATITGDLFLNDPFRSEGKVTFVGATIGRQVNCTGGHFRRDGDEGIALSLDAADVKGLLLPVVNLRVLQYWLPNAADVWGKALFLWVWASILIGWMLATALLASLNRMGRPPGSVSAFPTAMRSDACSTRLWRRVAAGTEASFGAPGEGGAAAAAWSGRHNS